MQMRRSADLFFSSSSAQNFANENSVRMWTPHSSLGRMISFCSLVDSRASAWTSWSPEPSSWSWIKSFKVTPLWHGNETIRLGSADFFFSFSSAQNLKFSPRENASFISRPYDQLLQSCQFPSIRLDKLIPRADFLILNQIVYRWWEHPLGQVDPQSRLPDLESNRLSLIIFPLMSWHRSILGTLTQHMCHEPSFAPLTFHHWRSFLFKL